MPDPAEHVVLDAETRRLAEAFDVDLSSGAPSWLVRLDGLRRREAAERPLVAEHAGRVAAHAAELAAEVGLSDGDVERLRSAVLWHDVGKLRTPDAILAKTTPFTPEERAVMQRHASDGAEMMGDGVPRILVEVADSHHERYDGHGYDGLKDEAIPYAARIVQIGDVYDALVSKREYKEPMRPLDALTMMTRDAPVAAFGRRGFDPFLLRRFAGLRLREIEAGLGPSTAPAERSTVADLRAFADSEPMRDLDYGDVASRVHVARDGTRSHLAFHDGVTPTVVARTGADGRPEGPEASAPRTAR